MGAGKVRRGVTVPDGGARGAGLVRTK